MNIVVTFLSFGAGFLVVFAFNLLVAELFEKRKRRALHSEGLNGVTGVDIAGTLVSGIHGVCNCTGRSAVTDASQRAYTGRSNSIGV